MFVPASTFLVSGVSALATPLVFVLVCSLKPQVEWHDPPAVSEVLRDNEMLEAAAVAARAAGVDLIQTQVQAWEDNAPWIERMQEAPSLGGRELQDELSTTAYRAFLFRPKVQRGWLVEWAVVTWVLIRQSDLHVLAVVQDRDT